MNGVVKKLNTYYHILKHVVKNHIYINKNVVTNIFYDIKKMSQIIDDKLYYINSH